MIDLKTFYVWLEEKVFEVSIWKKIMKIIQEKHFEYSLIFQQILVDLNVLKTQDFSFFVKLKNLETETHENSI